MIIREKTVNCKSARSFGKMREPFKTFSIFGLFDQLFASFTLLKLLCFKFFRETLFLAARSNLNYFFMPTKITQVEDAERGKMILRIEGSMTLDDAVLLEKIALELRGQLDSNLTLDLADLHFMDSESAPIIKRMEREHGFEIEGIEVFLQNVVAETEAKTNGNRE